MARKVTARFRYNAALAIAAFVAICGAVPLAASRWYLSFVLLVPLVVLVWAWRAGVDVRGDRGDHLVVRYPFHSRRIDAAEVRGFTITRRRVSAVLTDDSTHWLPAVSGTRLPLLTSALHLKVPTASQSS
ncbi:MAG TPA: PH domain-containing protein [Actinocatenispora sp.]